MQLLLMLNNSIAITKKHARDRDDELTGRRRRGLAFAVNQKKKWNKKPDDGHRCRRPYYFFFFLEISIIQLRMYGSKAYSELK